MDFFLSTFSENKIFTSTSDFMQSNNFITKMTFFIFVIFVLIILFQIITRIIVYVYAYKTDIVLLPGTIDARHSRTIVQDNKHSNILLRPSTNKLYGIEFTWSVWILINELELSNTQFHNVFFKGNYNPNLCSNLNVLTNGPGLYILNNLTTHSATLYLHMDTYQQPSVYFNNQNKCNTSNAISIPNIPLNSWVNVVITCYGKQVDIYINGIISTSVELKGVPKQNSGDVYIGANNGFSGKISGLRYIARKLYNSEILDIYNKGPNTKILDSTLEIPTKQNYLAFNWYTN